jgi:hypothetical protein
MGEERRITDLTEISAFRANDYIAVDNASEAQTKKLPASAITGAISAAQTDATRALNIARSTSSFPTGDAYSSSSAYKVGDMVIYNNTLYRCKTACSAASWSVNANNFEAISLASALTDVNNDLNASFNSDNYQIISSGQRIPKRGLVILECPAQGGTVNNGYFSLIRNGVIVAASAVPAKYGYGISISCEVKPNDILSFVSYVVSGTLTMKYYPYS